MAESRTFHYFSEHWPKSFLTHVEGAETCSLEKQPSNSVQLQRFWAKVPQLAQRTEITFVSFTLFHRLKRIFPRQNFLFVLRIRKAIKNHRGAPK